MIDNEAAKRLLRLLDEADKPLYLFMDEQEQVLDSDWFDNDYQALQHARSFDSRVVNILRYVACADNDQEYYGVFD